MHNVHVQKLKVTRVFDFTHQFKQISPEFLLHKLSREAMYCNKKIQSTSLVLPCKIHQQLFQKIEELEQLILINHSC